MIHSKEREPYKLTEFCKKYKKLDKKVPLVLVPTTYNHYSEKTLKKMGANIIIYANQLIRASLKSMKETAKIILEKECGNEEYLNISDIKDIIII